MPKPIYPDENFFLDVIVRYFADIGCEEEESSGPDLICSAKDSGVRWVIEIVGGSEALESRFRAALGSLLSRMDAGPEANYALVTADFPEYALARIQVPEWTREVLNLSWFIVDEQGKVNAIPPYGPIDPARLRRALEMEAKL